MENDKQYSLLLTLLDIFQTQTDESHTIKTPTLQSLLEQKGLHADRRTIYKCIGTLQEHGYPIYKAKGYSYYMQSLFSQEEAFILSESISSTTALSKEDTKQLLHKIQTTLSIHQQMQLPICYVSPSKTENTQIKQIIQILLKAIATCCFVTFYYYDMTVTKQKKYRRNQALYRLTPYALVSNNGKYYCVFYDSTHQSFSNYRLDKMENVHLCEDNDIPHPFSLENHMRDSMQMYHGSLHTVRAIFPISLANQVFDQFGSNVIISHVTDTTFTANIKTTLSPTLTSWFLLFYNQVEILYPKSLIEEMHTIGTHLIKQYRGKENER